LPLLDLELAFLDASDETGVGNGSVGVGGQRGPVGHETSGLWRMPGSEVAKKRPHLIERRDHGVRARLCGRPVRELLAVVDLGFLVVPALRELVVVEQRGAVHTFTEALGVGEQRPLRLGELWRH
jgi:hypothetical protein